METAAGAGVPTVAPKSFLVNMGQQSNYGKRNSPNEQLEKQLERAREGVQAEGQPKGDQKQDVKKKRP